MWGMTWGRWGGDQLETKDAGEEAMEGNNWASQNSQRDVQLKEERRSIKRDINTNVCRYSCKVYDILVRF